jgi:hypothetical protein
MNRPIAALKNARKPSILKDLQLRLCAHHCGQTREAVRTRFAVSHFRDELPAEIESRKLGKAKGRRGIEQAPTLSSLTPQAPPQSGAQHVIT